MDSISPSSYIQYEPCNDMRGMTSNEITKCIAAVNRQSLDFHITTAEGDYFTFESTSVSAAAYAAYQAPTTSAQAVSVSSSNEFSLSVQGDLSKEEVRDISKAIHTYGKVLKDVTSGRAQPAEAHARQLTRLDEISSFEGTFTSEQYLSAQEQSLSITG